MDGWSAEQTPSFMTWLPSLILLIRPSLEEGMQARTPSLPQEVEEAREGILLPSPAAGVEECPLARWVVAAVEDHPSRPLPGQVQVSRCDDGT